MPPVTKAGPNVFGTTDIGTTLSVTINENGTGYYLVQAAENAAPDVAAVLAGNSFAMMANSMVNQSITGLTAAKLYKIYFVAKDATHHVQATVQSVAFTTIAAVDNTPPVTSVGPNVSVVATDTTVSVSQTINEAGTGYYLMQAADLTPPTVAAVKAATAFAMSANTPVVVALSGLSASTAYTYYFVAKDAANNDQAAVQSVNVTTIAAAADPDTTPDAFTIPDQTGVALSAVITSAPVTVTGINSPTAVTILGGTFSIAGGAYGATGNVTNGQTVTVRHTSSASNSTTTSAVLNVGGVTDSFDVTTSAAAPLDTTPNTFDFTDLSNQALSTVVSTNTVTVAGIDTAVSASTTLGTLVKNGVDTGLASTTVVAGDTLAVKLTTSAGYNTTINGTATIGTGATSADAFAVITAAPDVTPPSTTAGPSISVAATDTTVSVSQTINEGGTGYYLMKLAAAAAPTVAEVKAGTAFAMIGGTPAVVALSGLTASTNYKYYFVAKDAANNDQAAVSTGLAITTTAASDLTAPLTTAAPSVSATTSTGTTLSVTINEPGTGYYLVQAFAAAAPTVDAVKAGTAFAMSANVAATQAISGLSAGTAHKIYFVAKDAANNVQTAVQSVSVTTTGLPSGYVSQGGLTWTPNTIGSASFGGDFNNWGVSGGYTTWATANNYCTTTTINGQTGWRLPTMDELVSLGNSGAINGQGWELETTWSSTPYGPYGPGSYYAIFLPYVANWDVGAGPNYVSCVR